MAMKMVGRAILFPSTPKEVWGICETQNVAQEAGKTEIDNEDGDTVALLYVGVGKRKFSGTYTPYAGAEASPVTEEDLIGEEMEFFINDGLTKLMIHVDNAALSRKKNGAPEFSIDGYHYPAIPKKA